MFGIISDLRHALRVARATPGQTALMAGTLSLAIGAATIGFSFADTAMLRGMPVDDPARTLIVYGIDPRQPGRRGGVFFDDYMDFRERARTVERLSAWARSRSAVLRRGDTAAAEVGRAAGDLFGAWGLDLVRGRGLRPGDDAPGAPRVAVLAHHYWQQMFDSSPAVIGETILLDGVAHEIVGVVDPTIEFGTFVTIDIWAPLPLERGSTRDARTVMVTGRVVDGVSVRVAAAELESLARAMEAEYPATNRGRTVVVLPANRAVGGAELVMSLLIAAVVLVMVIASANVAGVLLVRTMARQREFGLRVALGARRGRVFRQLAAEGLLLAALGAAGGLLAAEAGLRLIRSVNAEPIFQQFVIDWHEVAFVGLIAIATPLVFSLAPAVAAMRFDLVSLLNAGEQRSGASGGRGRNVLVVAQLALAVTLVTVGGLVLRTAVAMATAPTGFETSRLLVFALTFDEQNTPGAAARRHIVRAIEAQLGRSDEAVAVGALDAWPAISVESAAPIEVDALPTADEGEAAIWAHVVGVDAQALTTLGVPLLAGRALTEADIETDAPVALISAQAAARYLGGIDAALGRRLTTRVGGVIRERQIVGITADVRNVEPERGIPPRVWVPLSVPRAVAFVVRGPGDPIRLAPTVRRIARDLAPGVPLDALEAYDQGISRRGGSDRVVMGMLASFAGVALIFAVTGLYGSVAYSASQRRAEFGTRFALGAQVRDVAGLVVRQAFTLLAVGLALGLAGGLAAAHAMRRLLYGVTPLDPLNVAGVVVLLALATLAASVVPAWRAARVDVVAALRAD